MAITEWTFDKDRLRRLKLAYEQAKKEGSDQFIFEHVPLITNYAKYLIEYLDSQLEELNER